MRHTEAKQPSKSDKMAEPDIEHAVDCFADHVLVLAKTAADAFLLESSCVSKERLETIGAHSNDDHPALREGSHVYVAYSGESPLYAGETGVTVRSRFMSDGSGSHSRKQWYHEVSHVRFVALSCDSKYYRKLIEAALVIGLRPREQMPVR